MRNLTLDQRNRFSAAIDKAVEKLQEANAHLADDYDFSTLEDIAWTAGFVGAIQDSLSTALVGNGDEELRT